jgi:hypothetical protein
MSINLVVWALHPLVHGWDLRDCAVRDLTIQGDGLDRIRPAIGRYTLSGIHFYNAQNTVIERVAIRDWEADGFSLQLGENVAVRQCEATGCLGNGFHPGTGLKHSVFEECLGKGNGAGLYFCWHNDGHVLRKNHFIENRGGGVNGLGHPGDRNNLLEENVISDNGGVGIAINGDPKCNNVIRSNLIENNSRQSPGEHPGIHIRGPATEITIEGNTIRDTQPNPTQHIGIEETEGKNRDKPVAPDENVIRGNTFCGHKIADIVIIGPRTVAENNGDAKVVKGGSPDEDG